jgi:hypothetical protein
MQENAAYPEWTDYQKKNGLDPLGMQVGSVNLYQRLLPGISNVTLRIRYYGLYAWLSRTYSKEIRNTDPKSWQRFVRRAEALYALIAQRKGSEHGVAGVNWAERTLRDTDDKTIDFAVAAEPDSPDYYLKQAWGAFGAAYGSQLEVIGILKDADSHSILVPDGDIGNAAADAFGYGLSDLSRPFLSAINDGNVTLSILDKLAPITPSAIPQNSAERSCYENILFANLGNQKSEDIERRRSLLLLLATTQLHGHVPQVADVRWMLYAGRNAENKALPVLNSELDEQRHRWWVYQSNDLLHVCYESLLKFCLDVLSETPSGVSMPRLIGECTDAS